MLINFTELLSKEGKSKKFNVNVDFDKFKSRAGVYDVVDKQNFELTVTNAGDRRLLIEGEVRLSMNIPCARCLEDVRYDFVIPVSKIVDTKLSDDDRINGLDEQNFIDDHSIDVDILVYGEILVNMPGRVLCSDSCKGLCNSCGMNLNKGTCNCEDTSLDPRMAAIRDIFNNFKEV